MFVVLLEKKGILLFLLKECYLFLLVKVKHCCWYYKEVLIFLIFKLIFRLK